jgi:hypothetical protein
METQARVLQNLNNFKKAREQKQQKLGAIEDAINESKDNLRELYNMMKSEYENLAIEFEGVLSNISEGVDRVSSMSFDTENNITDTHIEYTNIADELSNLGVDMGEYSPEAVDELFNNFNQLKEDIDNLNTLANLR